LSCCHSYRGRKKNGVKEKGLKLGKKLFPIAKTLSAPVAFLEQISAKHRQTLGSAYSQAPVTQKLKIMANIVTGSATGFNFFKDEYQTPLSQFNVSNVLNKWTQTGGTMLAYGILAKAINKSAGSNIAPLGDKVKSIGKQLIIGGAIGGILDDKPISTNSSQNGTAQFSPQLNTAMITNSGYSSGDSTEGSL
jgi:hypothetical protein